MSDRLGQYILLAFLLGMFFMIQARAGNTYVNDFPNIEVSEPDCYSFDITVSQASGSTATLTVRVNDVDEESGELDEVYLNNVFLGYLSGNDGVWSTTSFDIASSIIYDGINTIRICIDPDGGEATTWRAEIDWGQILVDGGSAEDAEITSVSASGPWNVIQVQTAVSATNTDTYRLEINLLDDLGNNKDIDTETFALTGGSSTTRYAIVALPVEPSGSETFTIEANLFNQTTGIQQSVKTTPWTYSSEPPTDITLTNSHINENSPALSVIGLLTAIDADSVAHTFSILGGDIAAFSISGNELLSALSFDHETRNSYSIQLEAEDEDHNAYAEWFTITVDDVNETPIAQNDTPSVVEGSTLLVNVLANDSDPDSDALDVTSVTPPSQGTAIIQHDNRVLYTPDPGACGSDSFSYTINDGKGASASASVTIALENVSPTAAEDMTSTPEETSVQIPVLTNDSDPGGGNLTILSAGLPAYGKAVVMGSEIRYTPASRFEGSDRFSYTIQDPCGATAVGWVNVRVTHTNHPPTANAGSFYHGIVDEPVVLDASFSSDPDLGDTLQYRWDLDGDGSPDTDWSSNPRLTNYFRRPVVGQIILEVRDLYRGQPTGDIAQATALIRIASIQSLQIFVFEDLNGDGILDPGEPGLPGIDVLIAGATLTTEADGGISIELDAGEWSVSITEDAIALLESRGFAVLNADRTVNLATSAVEIVPLGVAKTSTRLKGVVYVDVNGNEEFDEQDRLVEGVAVMLDGDEENLTLTDALGTFAFRNVAYGNHEVYVVQTGLPEDENPLSLLIPFALTRTDKAEIQIIWPYDLGPQGGFLQVEVKRSGEE